jgi:hypothetical protein
VKATAILTLCTISLTFFLLPAAEPEKPKTETYRGQVVPLADILKKERIDLDPDARPHSLALLTDDGKVYPLVKDEGARLFFRDARLLKRPMTIQGRLVAGRSLLQVLQVQSLKDGKPHEVYYWCEICAIRRNSLDEKGICDCCGGPMELKEKEVKP